MLLGVGEMRLFSCWNFWNSESKSTLPVLPRVKVIGEMVDEGIWIGALCGAGVTVLVYRRDGLGVTAS